MKYLIILAVFFAILLSNRVFAEPVNGVYVSEESRMKVVDQLKFPDVLDVTFFDSSRHWYVAELIRRPNRRKFCRLLLEQVRVKKKNYKIDPRGVFNVVHMFSVNEKGECSTNSDDYIYAGDMYVPTFLIDLLNNAHKDIVRVINDQIRNKSEVFEYQSINSVNIERSNRVGLMIRLDSKESNLSADVIVDYDTGNAKLVILDVIVGDVL